MKWCVRREYLQSSPCDRLRSPAKFMSRDRILTNDELVKVFLQARAARFPFGTIVQLLILTGQRRSEIGSLRWELINEKERTITFPAALTKNKRTHTFPYGQLAAAILSVIPHQSPYVFPAARDQKKGKPATVFAGWAKPKADFDRAWPAPYVPGRFTTFGGLSPPISRHSARQSTSPKNCSITSPARLAARRPRGDRVPPRDGLRARIRL